MIVCVVMVSTGCSKSYNSPGSTTNSTDPLIAIVTSGSWTVGSYTQMTVDKTSSLQGYSFVFANGGKLTATNGSSTTEGSWSSTQAAAGIYGGPPTKATFTISLGTTAPLDKISKTWNLADDSNGLIHLDNPQSVEDEHIALKKS